MEMPTNPKEVIEEIKPKAKLKKKTAKKKRKPTPPLFALGDKAKKILWGVAAFFVLAAGTVFTGIQLENRDSFCASCHTQNEEKYYQRTLQKETPTDLATFHAEKETRCIDCHTGGGVFGRADGLRAGAMDLYAFFTEDFPQPAPMHEPLPDENCLKCHAAIYQKRSFNNHFHVILPEWQKQDKNAAFCVSCHNSHGTNGDAKIQYLNEQDTVQICQKCHMMAGEG